MHGVDLEDEGAGTSGSGGVGLQPSVGSDPTQTKGSPAWDAALKMGRELQRRRLEGDASHRRN